MRTYLSTTLEIAVAEHNFTPGEAEALRLLQELEAVLGRIIDAGGDDGLALFDTGLLLQHTSALRNAVLAQSTIRMYPGIARPLGGTADRCPSNLWTNGTLSDRCDLDAGHDGDHHFRTHDHDAKS